MALTGSLCYACGPLFGAHRADIKNFRRADVAANHLASEALVKNLAGKDRLIVALDVSSHEEAMELVRKLDNVSFFKVGLQLLMAGDLLGFIDRLRTERKQAGQVFIDLKIGGDIRNTITEFMRSCMKNSIVKFITLLETVPLAISLDTVTTAKQVRGEARDPRLLMVPYLSSLNEKDLDEGSKDLNEYIVEKAKVMLDAGCDGLIVSGEAIELCRKRFPHIDIVSPGIRPSWSPSHDDHKRFTTPARAITLGADYLVVGRPIIRNPNPRQAAQLIIDEIDSALMRHNSNPSPSGSGGESGYTAMAAKGLL